MTPSSMKLSTLMSIFSGARENALLCAERIATRVRLFPARLGEEIASDRLFEAAARERVYGEAVAYAWQGFSEGLEAEAVVAEVLRISLAEVARAARSRSSSTSQASNLYDACKLSEWARVVEVLGGPS